MSVLDDILAGVREDLVGRQAETSLEALQALAAARPSALAAESGWVRVHAAEALAACGEPAAARAAFLTELAVHGEVPRDRIGIHRVLARTAPDPATRGAEVAWLAAS